MGGRAGQQIFSKTTVLPTNRTQMLENSSHGLITTSAFSARRKEIEKEKKFSLKFIQGITTTNDKNIKNRLRLGIKRFLSYTYGNVS